MIRSILGHACVAYRPAAPVSLPATPWGISHSDRFRLDLPVIDLIGPEIIDLGKDQYTQTILENSSGVN